MIRELTPLEKLSRIDELLEARFASAPLGNKKDPLDELVYILLSVQTQAAGFNRSYDELRRAYRSWRAVLHAPSSSLVRILRPSGLARQKAHRLKAILDRILQDAKATAVARGAEHCKVSSTRCKQLELRNEHGVELGLWPPR